MPRDKSPKQNQSVADEEVGNLTRTVVRPCIECKPDSGFPPEQPGTGANDRSRIAVCWERQRSSNTVA